MIRLSIGIFVVLFLLGLLLWLGSSPQIGAGPATMPTTRGTVVFRLGVIPERDLLQQRKRYRALAEVVSAKLGWRVELVTAPSYQDVLHDFETRQIDAAFLGSLVVVLAADRLEARVVAKSELPEGVSSYSGEIFVKDDSPIKTVNDLAGRSIAMVPTTMAGHLFPMEAMFSAGVLTGRTPARAVFVGTHDDAILAVSEGACDAGAAKNLRLDDVLKQHPEMKLRKLAHSEPVPENALTLRRDLDETLRRQLIDTLLTLQTDPAGGQALQAFGVKRFVPTSLDEYGAIYRMCDRLAPVWDVVGISGPPPKKPQSKGG